LTFTLAGIEGFLARCWT